MKQEQPNMVKCEFVTTHHPVTLPQKTLVTRFTTGIGYHQATVQDQFHLIGDQVVTAFSICNLTKSNAILSCYILNKVNRNILRPTIVAFIKHISNLETNQTWKKTPTSKVSFSETCTPHSKPLLLRPHSLPLQHDYSTTERLNYQGL